MELVSFHSYLGWLAGEQRHTDKSASAHRLALAHALALLAEEPTSPRYRNLAAGCHTDIGNTIRWMKPEEAERHFQLALKLLLEKGSHPTNIGRVHLALAELHFQCKRWPDADKALNEAERAYAAHASKSPHWVHRERLADIHTARGRLRLATNRPADAAASYRTAIDLLRKAQSEHSAAAAPRDALTKVKNQVQAALKQRPANRDELRDLLAEVEKLLSAPKDANPPAPKPD